MAAAEIKRDFYLNELVLREGNGMVKVITGLSRSGKSYLLFRLFKDYLVGKGVKENQIIEISLDDFGVIHLRDPKTLYEYVTSRIVSDEQYYVLIDEVQFLPDFEDVLNGLLRRGNIDLYVTGSNSKFLSSDVLTHFRGRGDELRVYPLSFFEFSQAIGRNDEAAFNDYVVYGGLPATVGMKTERQKIQYLSRVYRETYLRDIVERNQIRRPDDMEDLIRVLASSVGSLTNSKKLENTFKSVKQSAITDKTIKSYIENFKDAFLIDDSLRYDVKGKKYINTPLKYYFTDTGVRNAILGFRQIEETHLMENVIFNELKRRGYHVDVGVVEERRTQSDGKIQRVYLEIDFVATLGRRKYYVQSAFAMNDREKREQEERPLIKTPDSFKKIIVTGSGIGVKNDENGITTMNIREFLLNENSLDL